MKKILFSVRDDVAEIYQDPMIEPNSAFARRKFQVMMRTLPDGVFPGEFSLWEIGEFDDHTGIISGGNPTMLVRGVSDGD